MTGTAELVAQAIEMDLGDAARFELQLMDGLAPSVFDAFIASNSPVLMCTSTYGQGDVPDNSRALFDALQAARPDLSALRYGLIALGDRTYLQTYCYGGKKWDALLSELGAQRVGEPFFHDASSGTLPEMEAIDWARGWLGELQAGELTSNSTEPIPAG